MPDTIELDPLEQLEGLLAGIPEARDRQRLGDALDVAVQAAFRTEEAISHLEQLVGYASLVREFLEAQDLEQCNLLLRTIRAVGQQVSQAADSSSLRDAAEKLSQLPGQVQQVDGLFQRGWKAKIDHTFAATGRLGSVLRQIPETRELGAEMETLIDRAKHLATSMDNAAQDAAQFTALTVERDVTKTQLAKSGTGQEVINFLLAVATDTATLANVTAEVREWLDARQASERFKVGL